MELRALRKKYGLTQDQVALFLGISRRTYLRYENEESYGDPLKRGAMIRAISDCYSVTEEQGLLSQEQIAASVGELLDREYSGEVDFCYLFGSYAKGTAKPDSDVDLYVSSSLTGLRFVGLIERLRQTLHKRVDLIRSSELRDNVELANEIMKTGVKIYG